MASGLFFLETPLPGDGSRHAPGTGEMYGLLVI